MAEPNDLTLEVTKPDGTKAEVSMRYLFGDIIVDELLHELGVAPAPEPEE